MDEFEKKIITVIFISFYEIDIEVKLIFDQFTVREFLKSDKIKNLILEFYDGVNYNSIVINAMIHPCTSSLIIFFHVNVIL